MNILESWSVLEGTIIAGVADLCSMITVVLNPMKVINK